MKAALLTTVSLATILLASCGDLNYEETRFTCDKNHDCPKDYQCCEGFCAASCLSGITLTELGADSGVTRKPDAGFTDDVGPSPDADNPAPDVGIPTPDAGEKPDTGAVQTDAGVKPDSGIAPDVGTKPDAETQPDTSVEEDAGVQPDTGTPQPDAAIEEDTGVQPDAGGGEPDFSCKEGICTDNVSGLMWEAVAATTTYNSLPLGAEIYCSKLTLGGFTWRVPTIFEVQTLFVGCPKTQSGGACDDPGNLFCTTEPELVACGGCDQYAGPNKGYYIRGELQGPQGIYFSSSGSPTCGENLTVKYNTMTAGYLVTSTSSAHCRCVRSIE